MKFCRVFNAGGWKRVFLLLAVLVLCAGWLAGCRKRPTSSTASLPPEPVYRMDTAATPAAQAKILTSALVTYEESHAGTPNDLNQLVEKRLVDRLPLPPPGKKFAIDPKKHEVVLINQ
jgi:hypothetical protein